MPGISQSASDLLRYAASVSGWEAPRGSRPAPEDPAQAILIVDPSPISRRLLRGMLQPGGYRLLETSRAVEAVDVLHRTHVDLVILDLMLPETSGLELCRQLKSDRHTFLMPVVIVTSVHDLEAQVSGLAAGADEYLVRPLNTAVLRTRVAALLRQKAALDSLEEAESLLFVLAQAIEQRDEAISGHCKRLEDNSLALGTALGLSPSQLVALRRGAYLHDIGKVSVPDSILFKPGPLTPLEWQIMRQHPIRGEEICRPVKSLAPVLPIIRSHHEHWDGSGYPDGLAGQNIPLLARILQIADIYDALTSPRPYKPPLPGPRAVDILEEESRRGWRDPHLVRLFRQIWEATLWPAEQAPLAQRMPPASLREVPEELPVAAFR